MLFGVNMLLLCDGGASLNVCLESVTVLFGLLEIKTLKNTNFYTINLI